MAGQIRAVALDDAAAIQAIYAPYVTETIISFEATPPNTDEIAARIQKVTSKYPWLVYVTEGTAETNGNNAPVIAGYVYASSHSERAAYQWSVDVSVYVHANYHRRNIGRGLYTALFEILRTQGFVNAYAGIALPNDGSVGIHESFGFELVGVYEKVGYKFGEWHDVGWWGLCLTPPPQTPLPPKLVSAVVDTPMWDSAMHDGVALIRG